jgi:hypothetical protein
MFMQISRLFALVGPLVLSSACSPSKEETEQATKMLEQSEQVAAKEAVADGKVECAVSGETALTRSCETEKIVGRDGQLLVIRHPNGGFRRFKILTDGRGLKPAEGADPVAIQLLNDGKIEVVIAGDKYHLPAQIKASAAAKTQ